MGVACRLLGFAGALVQGIWYIVASNAQNLFSIFGLQGGQCATTNFQPAGQYRMRRFAK